MGGFIKGIVVGVVSFVLGFGILSVVMPVNTPSPTPERPATSSTELAPVPQPDTAASEQEPAVEVADAAPDAAGSEPAEEAELLVADSDQPEPAATEADTMPAPETAGMDEADAQPAAEATAPVPPLSTQPEVAAPAPEPAGEPITEEIDAPAEPEAEDAGTEAAMLDALTQAIEETAPEPAPEPALEPAPVIETPEAEQPVAEAPADPAPTAEEPAVEDPQTETPAEETATLVEGTEAEPASEPAQEAVAEPVAPDADMPEAEAPAADVPVTDAPATDAPQDLPASDAEGEAPQSELAPVQAGPIPRSEPLIAQTPPPVVERPRIEGMPTGASDSAGVAVRRAGEPQASVRRGIGTSIGTLPTQGDAGAETSDTRPAVERFAAEAVVPEGIAPMGVLLVDSAAAETALRAFPVPVTISMDPYEAEAPRRARAYREAGHEIVLRAASVPPRAQPSDIAVTLDAWHRAFPEVVGFVDVPINGLGANARLAREFTAMAADDGFGIISLRDGLDAFLQSGRAAGLASVPVYRVLDDEEHSEFTIRRLIDRAAFEALRQPNVLIMGDAANFDTMSELRAFARGEGREGVTLVPATAVMARN